MKYLLLILISLTIISCDIPECPPEETYERVHCEVDDNGQPIICETRYYCR